MTHHERVQAIAAALGCTARIKDTNEHYGALDSIVPVGVYHDTYRKRLNVSVNWPQMTETDGSTFIARPRDILTREQFNTAPAEEISLSPERAPAAIARDIKRRLIEPNVTTYCRAIEYINERTAARNAREDIAAQLVNKFAKFYEQDGRDKSQARVRRGFGNYHLPDLRCSDDVRFEAFNCTPEIAAQLLAILVTTAKQEE